MSEQNGDPTPEGGSSDERNVTRAIARRAIPDGGRSDEGGTYTLLVELQSSAPVEFGALGRYDLDTGWYAYVGSALGPGGFARIDRHRELARGERDVRHWHIDSLLGHPETDLDGVVRSAGVTAECAIARTVDGDRLDGVGASDCDCDTHLVYAPEHAPLERSVRRAHERARDGKD